MEVALWYEAEEDIEQDLEEYLRWLREAADQEHLESMYRLANRQEILREIIRS